MAMLASRVGQTSCTRNVPGPKLLSKEVVRVWFASKVLQAALPPMHIGTLGSLALKKFKPTMPSLLPGIQRPALLFRAQIWLS